VALLAPALPFVVPSSEVSLVRIWGLGGRPVGKFILASILRGPSSSGGRCRKDLGRAAPDVSAFFFHRGHQPRRPLAKIGPRLTRLQCLKQKRADCGGQHAWKLSLLRRPFRNFLDGVARTAKQATITWGGELKGSDTFGHEPALVARCCSPVNLLGSSKLVGTPWCNDARRCHQCDWHGQGGRAAMASCRTSEQLRRVSGLTRGTQWTDARLIKSVAQNSCKGPPLFSRGTIGSI
jgi:hypothetical protein